MKVVSKTPMLQAWEACRITVGEGTSLEKKMRGLVWDILSFKRWQNNPKRSQAELEELCEE